MAPLLLNMTAMRTALELVYQYRHLLGKSELGTGLSIDEIDALYTIEALFVGDHGGLDVWRCTRQFAREKVDISARLRSADCDDPVRIVDIAPGGMVCRATPFVDENSTIELIVDDDELGLTYRFKAIVVWLRDDVDDDFMLGIELVGTPLLLRHGRSEHTRQISLERAA